MIKSIKILKSNTYQFKLVGFRILGFTWFNVTWV